MALENEAPIKEALGQNACCVSLAAECGNRRAAATHASRTTPILSVALVPSLPMHTVARGDTSSAMEMDRPPTNAKAKGEAPVRVPDRR